MIPQYKYSRKELIELQNLPISRAKPRNLNSEHESFDGYWDPQRWFSSHFASSAKGTLHRNSSDSALSPKSHEAMNDKLANVHAGYESDGYDNVDYENYRPDLTFDEESNGCHVIINSALKSASPSRQTNSRHLDHSRNNNQRDNGNRYKNFKNHSAEGSPQNFRRHGYSRGFADVKSRGWGRDGEDSDSSRRGYDEFSKGYESDSREVERVNRLKHSTLVRKNSLQDIPVNKDNRSSPQDNTRKSHRGSPRANYGFRRWGRQGSPRERSGWQGNRSDGGPHRQGSPAFGGNNSWHRESPTWDRKGENSENKSWRRGDERTSFRQNDPVKHGREERKFPSDSDKFGRDKKHWHGRQEKEPEWLYVGLDDRYDTVELKGFSSDNLSTSSSTRLDKSVSSASQLGESRDQCKQSDTTEAWVKPGDFPNSSQSTIKDSPDVISYAARNPDYVTSCSFPNDSKNQTAGSAGNATENSEFISSVNQQPSLRASAAPNVFNFEDIFTFDNIPDFNDTLETAADLGGSRFQQWFAPAAETSAEDPKNFISRHSDNDSLYSYTKPAISSDVNSTALDEFKYLDDLIKSIQAPMSSNQSTSNPSMPLMNHSANQSGPPVDFMSLMDLLSKSQKSAYSQNSSMSATGNLFGFPSLGVDDSENSSKPVTTDMKANQPVYFAPEMTSEDIERSLKAILSSPPTVTTSDCSATQSNFPSGTRGRVLLASDIEADLLSSNNKSLNANISQFPATSCDAKELSKGGGMKENSYQRFDSLPQKPSSFDIQQQLLNQQQTGWTQQQQQQLYSGLHSEPDNLGTFGFMNSSSPDFNKPQNSAAVRGSQLDGSQLESLSSENSQKEFVQNYVLQQQLLKMTPGSIWSDFLNPHEAAREEKIPAWTPSSSTAPLLSSNDIHLTERGFPGLNPTTEEQMKISLTLQQKLLQYQQLQQQKLNEELRRQEQQNQLLAALAQQKVAIDQQLLNEALLKQLEQQSRVQQQNELSRQLNLMSYHANNSNLATYSRPAKLSTTSYHLPPSPRSLHIPFNTPPSGLSPLPPSPRSLPPHLSYSPRFSANSPSSPSRIVLHPPPPSGRPPSRPAHITLQPPLSNSSSAHLGLPAHSPILLTPPKSPQVPSARLGVTRNRPPQLVLQPPPCSTPQQMSGRFVTGLPPAGSQRPVALHSTAPHALSLLQPPSSPHPSSSPHSPLLYASHSPHSLTAPLVLPQHTPNASPRLSPSIIPVQRGGGGSPVVRIPSPQELSGLAQSILQNALIKKQLEEQKERFLKKQMERAKSPNLQMNISNNAAGGFMGGNRLAHSVMSNLSVASSAGAPADPTAAGGAAGIRTAGSAPKPNATSSSSQLSGICCIAAGSAHGSAAGSVSDGPKASG